VTLDLDRDVLPALVAESEDGLVSSFNASLAYDTRNNTLMPDDGGRVELASTLAGGPLGGEIEFYRVELRGSQYFKGFGEGHVIEMLARGGYMDSFGGTETVPIFERFFLGGLDSLRGYKYRTVGPTEPIEEEPLGGNYYWFGSAEYSVPIIDRVRFAVFYDIGMAYSFDTQYNIANYNDNWGVGVRLNLPIGPLRLDYGIPINDSDGINDSSGRFQFSAGYTRDF
jgi:outer membrane protein insertion porin family